MDSRPDLVGDLPIVVRYAAHGVLSEVGGTWASVWLRNPSGQFGRVCVIPQEAGDDVASSVSPPNRRGRYDPVEPTEVYDGEEFWCVMDFPVIAADRYLGCFRLGSGEGVGWPTEDVRRVQALVNELSELLFEHVRWVEIETARLELIEQNGGEDIDVAMLRVSASRRIRWVNETAARWFGSPVDLLEGVRLNELCPSVARLGIEVAGSQGHERMMACQDVNGRAFHARMTCTALGHPHEDEHSREYLLVLRGADQAAQPVELGWK